MNWKKVGSMILAVSVAISVLAGCTEKKASEGDKVVLKYIMPGPGMQQDSKVVWAKFNEKLQEKLPNVEVDIEVISTADYKQRFLLMQTGREKMDIINTYTLDFATEVHNGSFMEIDSLVEKHGKELKSSLPEFLMGYMKIDNKLYGIPSYQMLVNGRAMVTREDYAEKYLNMDALKSELYNNEYCTDKVYDILDEYLKNLYDNGNIQYGFYKYFELPVKGYESLTNNLFVRVHDGSYKVEYKFMVDMQKKAYGIHADWYKKGYIRQDSLSANDDKQVLESVDGYVVRDIGWSPFADENFKKAGKNFITIPFSDKYFIPSTNAAGGTAISSSCKNPQEAMQFINLLQSDKELYNLLVFGIEGEHYTKISDERIETPYDSQGMSNSAYGIFKWIVGNTALAYDVQTEPEGYKKWVFEEANTSPYRSKLIGFAPDLSSVQDKIAQMDAIKGEYMNTIASGSLGDAWESKYNEWMEKLKIAGIDDVIAELQRQIDEFLASSN